MNSDVIVVGGGLAGGLTALRLALLHPEKRILLLEKTASLGGNHSWCVHDSENKGNDDLPALSKTSAVDWLAPLFEASWSSHDVLFPKVERTMVSTLHGFRSKRFHDGIVAKLGANVRLNCDVKRMTSMEVETHAGQTLRAPLIIDARGPRQAPKSDVPTEATHGWHKFVGFDIKLKAPHGLKRPIWQDARVPQMDGYRFFAVVPWSETEILVREHFLSSAATLNLERLSRSILAYVARAGWVVDSVVRKESASLPLPLVADLENKEEPAADEVQGEDFVHDTPVSVAGENSWFHSSSGLGLADAVRVADFISTLKELRTGPVRASLRGFRKQWNAQQSFYRTVNRMVFHAFEPSLRYQIMERFYGLPDDVIQRFYLGLTSRRDRVKILAARPLMRVRLEKRKWQDEPTEPLLSKLKPERSLS